MPAAANWSRTLQMFWGGILVVSVPQNKRVDDCDRFWLEHLVYLSCVLDYGLTQACAHVSVSFLWNLDKFEYVTCQSKQQISLWGDVMWGINRVLTCHFWGIAKLVRSCPLRQDYEVFPKKVLGEGCSGLVVMAKGRTDGRSLGGKVVQPGHSEAFEAVVSYYPLPRYFWRWVSFPPGEIC